MAPHGQMRRELLKARERIGAQLQQLEGAKIDPYSEGGMPDCRSIYSELQKELHDIDALLGSDADAGEEVTQSDYQPMVRMSADGSVGIPTSPTRAAVVLAILSLAGLVFLITFGLLTR